MSQTNGAPAVSQASLALLEHEEIHIGAGARTGVTIAVALHSTSRGPAIGGCRIKPYRSWGDGLADVVGLSRAMTMKCALAGLPHGGGKTVRIANAA